MRSERDDRVAAPRPRLKVAYDAKAIRLGEGMDEREAEYVASTVQSRLRPRARWGDEERVDPYHPTNRQLLQAVDFGAAAAGAHTGAASPQASAPMRRQVAVVAATFVVAGSTIGGAAIVSGSGTSLHRTSRRSPHASECRRRFLLYRSSQTHANTRPRQRAFRSPPPERRSWGNPTTASR